MQNLFDQLMNIRKKGASAFHMPGTKFGAALPRKYRSKLFSLDFTELEDTDNLRSPTGIILNAQKNAAKVYGADKSFFLVNGSTGGILACFLYLSKLGGRVLIDRSAHVSAVNAINLFGIKPVYVLPEPKREGDVPGTVTPQSVLNEFKKNPDIKAVFITSPNYYGMCADLKEISKICRAYGAILCVDAAHGAHFAFSPLLPECAVKCGADIAVMSVHKTMPAPTQTAIMHISKSIDACLMQECINSVSTTSPSYIFMAYTDFAIRHFAKNGEKIFKKLRKRISAFKKKCPLEIAHTDDFSRIVIKTDKNGYALSRHMYKTGKIRVEAADLHNVICIAGAGNSSRDFLRLLKACKSFVPDFNDKKIAPFDYGVPRLCSVPENAQTELCHITRAAGRISAATVLVYPPGIPVVMPREEMSADAAAYILSAAQAGADVHGMSIDYNIKVYSV